MFPVALPVGWLLQPVEVPLVGIMALVAALLLPTGEAADLFAAYLEGKNRRE